MNFCAADKFVGIIVICAVINFTFAHYHDTVSLEYLEPGDAKENSAPGFRIFCHTAKTKYFIYIWRSMIVHLHTNLENYNFYDGKTPEDIKKTHDVNQRSWQFNPFGTKKNKQLRINPFEDHCIGVYVPSVHNNYYKLSLELIKIDLWRVLLTICGIILFWNAPKLSKNSLFYYIVGICLGVTFSVLILIYFLSKLFTQGKTMYIMMGAGWAMSTWLARIISDNLQLILSSYKEYVAGYIIMSSVISFLVCYWVGPVTNTRTKKIIQWILQASGLMMIYISSHFTEASLGLCILLCLIYNFPIVAFHRSKSYWRRMFPKHRKFLSEDEYRKQGIQETEKALGNLKEYCSSPESNPWKTVLRLKDPVRFAKFMQGDSHLSDDETMQYDLEMTKLGEECDEEYEYTEDEYSEDA